MIYDVCVLENLKIQGGRGYFENKMFYFKLYIKIFLKK